MTDAECTFRCLANTGPTGYTPLLEPTTGQPTVCNTATPTTCGTATCIASATGTAHVTMRNTDP